MGQRGPATPYIVPQTPPRGDIRLESGDIIEELEGDADVAPDIEDLYPSEHSVGARVWIELLVFIHGGSPSPPILFMSRGARMCHRSPTKYGIGWSL